MENDMYSIGKVEEMCKITKKALRYYDKIGILYQIRYQMIVDIDTIVKEISCWCL